MIFFYYNIVIIRHHYPTITPVVAMVHPGSTKIKYDNSYVLPSFINSQHIGKISVVHIQHDYFKF